MRCFGSLIPAGVSIAIILLFIERFVAFWERDSMPAYLE